MTPIELLQTIERQRELLRDAIVTQCRDLRATSTTILGRADIAQLMERRVAALEHIEQFATRWLVMEKVVPHLVAAIDLDEFFTVTWDSPFDANGKLYWTQQRLTEVLSIPGPGEQ